MKKCACMYCPCRLCPHGFCPYYYHNSNYNFTHIGFIFFPDLVVGTSLPELFPELYFYP